MNNSLYSADGNQTYKHIPATQNLLVNNTTIACALVVVVWTILANGTLVVCFIINRKKTWPSFSTQILSLSLSDMCVGIASLPLAVLPTVNADVNNGVCSLLFFLFFASQCASLYHIVGICVHRCIVIHKMSRINEQRSDYRVPLILVISAWVLSLVVCSIPYVIYGDPDEDIGQCIVGGVFRGKTSQVSGFLFIVYVVPQVLTTALYICVCCRLWCIWNKVYPSQLISMENISGTAPPAIASVSNQVNALSSMESNRTHMKMQKSVIGTIGVLMLIFNICTIPLIVIFKMESEDLDTKRNLRFIASVLFILNSAVNPFVYALRTHWLKLALQKMFKDLFMNLCPRC